MNGGTEYSTFIPAVPADEFQATNKPTRNVTQTDFSNKAPLSHRSGVLAVSGLAGGRIHSLVHARSSTPVPILDSFTLVFFFFPSPVILIDVRRLREARLRPEDSNPRIQSSMLMPAHCVPKHHKSPFSPESYSGT